MYSSMRDSIYKIEDSKPKDYWKGIAKVPLGTRQLYDEYEEMIPEDEVVCMEIDTRDAQSRNPLNMLVCATSGTGKTRLMKNIVRQYHKQDYDILIIEPKAYEWYNAKKIGKGNRLHPYDYNDRLPIVSYAPNFIRAHMERNFMEMHNKMTYYSPDIRLMDNDEIWESFGIPKKVASMIVRSITQGRYDLTKIQRYIEGKKMIAQTKMAALTSLDNIIGNGFFALNKYLDLKKEWEEKKIVVVHYFSKDGDMMITDIGLILDLVRGISLEESRQGLRNIRKKLIVFDDAFYYAGTSSAFSDKGKAGKNLAIRNIVNCQNNYRTWGIDTIFTVQSPSSNAIFPALIDGCTDKIIGYTQNPESLRGQMPLTAFNIVANTDPFKKSLYVDEKNYIYEWVYCKGKTMWATFFPFDCTVGHG